MFYLKLTQAEADQMINNGIETLFKQGDPDKEITKFTTYTTPIEDTETGDLYWCVKNRQYDGVLYEIEEYVIQWG